MKDVDAPKGTTAFVDIVFDPESSVSGKGYRGRGRAMWLLVAYSQTVCAEDDLSNVCEAIELFLKYDARPMLRLVPGCLGVKREGGCNCSTSRCGGLSLDLSHLTSLSSALVTSLSLALSLS